MENTENKISTAPIGTAVFALTNRPDLRVDFLLREETAFINQLSTAKIPLRARLFNRNNVAILLVMFQLGTENPHLYETFLNYHEEGDYVARIFRLISNQDDLAFHLYGDSGSIEKSILMGNIFKSFFRAALKKIQDLPVWNSEQFAKELRELRLLYPSKDAFWEAIK